MSEMQVRRGGVDTEFHPQGLSLFELFSQVRLGNYFRRPAFNLFPIFRRETHGAHRIKPPAVRQGARVFHPAPARLGRSAPRFSPKSPFKSPLKHRRL